MLARDCWLLAIGCCLPPTPYSSKNHVFRRFTIVQPPTRSSSGTSIRTATLCTAVVSLYKPSNQHNLLHLDANSGRCTTAVQPPLTAPQKRQEGCTTLMKTTSYELTQHDAPSGHCRRLHARSRAIRPIFAPKTPRGERRPIRARLSAWVGSNDLFL